MKNNDKTDEELLAEVRENGKKEGTIENFLYNLMSTAHPNMIEMVEKQAVEMKKFGQAVGREMLDADQDPNKKSQFLSLFEKIAQNYSVPVEEKDDIPNM